MCVAKHLVRDNLSNCIVNVFCSSFYFSGSICLTEGAGLHCGGSRSLLVFSFSIWPDNVRY